MERFDVMIQEGFSVDPYVAGLLKSEVSEQKHPPWDAFWGDVLLWGISLRTEILPET